LTAATMARLLGNPQYLQHSLPGELYTAGLLHDIGKVVLATYVKDLFEQACALAREKSIPLHEAEMEVMGLDHAQLGGQVLDGWNLPVQILNAVRGHHALTDANANGSEIAKIIELADALAYYCGFEDGTGQPVRDPMKTAIIRSGQSPLSNPRTLQRVFEDASVTLAQKARIIRREEKLSNELVKSLTPPATKAYEHPHDFSHPQAQPSGFLASIAAWFRKLLSN
jgi:HD superfamily phosphohydrolase YqeK